MKPQQTRSAGWRRTILWSGLLAIVALAVGLPLAEKMAGWSATAPVVSLTPPAAATSPEPAVERTRVNAAFAKLPLIFEANQGQTDPQVRFLSRGPGYTLFLTPDEAVFNFRAQSVAGQEPVAVKLSTLRMRLLDANPQPEISGLDPVSTRINDYRGNDSQQWQIGVPTYAKTQLQSVYPGIDLIYYGNQRQLEYDFVVAPGADPARIRLALSGLDEVVQATLADNGDLVLNMAVGEMRWHKPVVYQNIAGQRQPVDGQFVLHPTEQDQAITLGFAIAAYDRSQPLIIDPVLAYSTFLGGMLDDYATGVAVDIDGNIYVTGATASVNFPGSTRIPSFTKMDVFVARFNVIAVDAYAMACSSVLSGAGKADAPEDKDDIASAITLDFKREGTALYIIGTTASSVFPGCALKFPSKLPVTSLNGSTDAFVAKIAPATCKLVSTACLGGSKDESGTGITVDALGNIYVTGYTSSAYSSTDELAAFPTTAGAYQPLLAGGFDAFVTKYSPAWKVEYSTYFGGTKDDKGAGIAVDPAPTALDPDINVYITGSTSSTNINTAGAFDQTLDGGSDAFVAKFNPNLPSTDPPDLSLIYSTYLGGTSSDSGAGIAVTVEKDSTTGGLYPYAYVTGTTASINFPITLDSFGTVYAGNGDAFVTKINPFGSMLDYSTYLGGSSADSGAAIALENSPTTGATKYIYMTGSTASNNFPVVSGAFDTMLGGTRDAFMAQIDMNAGQQLVYSTYLGGSNNTDGGAAIAINPATVGAGINYGIYVVGITAASDFPVTSNAYDYTINGSSKDAFIAKFWSDAGQDAEYTYTVTLTTAGPEKTLCKTNSSGGNYDAGDIVQLTPPTVAVGGLFVGWSPAPCGKEFAMPANNLSCIANCINKSGPEGKSTAVEYHHAGKDHYFNTANLDDITFLADNAQSGWNPTGYIFDTYPLDAAPAGTVPVARYYGGQQSDGAYKPDSHFYTGLTEERRLLDNGYSQICPAGEGSCTGEAWHYEKDEYRVYLPNGSTCPSGSHPVYRLYNNGYPAKDSNHRYTTDASVAAAMKAQGWTDEGVKMCVPGAGQHFE